MKRTVCSMVVALATVFNVFAEISVTSVVSRAASEHKVVAHVDKAYAMKKFDDGEIYVIRVKEEDGKWHDWYVIEDKEINDFQRSNPEHYSAMQFLGYESDGRDMILVDNLIDIAIE